MGGSSHGTSTSQTNPWKPQQPYLKDVFKRASSLYNTPMQYYGGQTYADFTPEQSQAQDWASRRALAGSDLTRGAQQGVADTMSGKYLNPDTNPYLGYYTDRAFQKAVPQFDSSAVSAGRYGSDAWGTGKGALMGDIAGNIYGGAYNNERANQMAAYQAAPALANQDYADISKLAAVGEEQQNMNQTAINDAMQRYNFAQMEPWQRLGMYDQFIEGQYGGTNQVQNAGGK